MSLSAADALKLSLKSWRLLSSSSAGERANAGAAADAFIRERGLSWGDVIAVDSHRPATVRPVDPIPTLTSREKMEFAVAHLDRLDRWQASFATDIWDDWRRPLTIKQQKHLDKIVRQLWAKGCRP